MEQPELVMKFLTVLGALLTLRTRRPPTGVFGPFGPEVPLGVSQRVSPKIGVCPKGSGEVFLGPFKKCPKSVFLDTFKSLFGHILGRGSKDPWSTPSDTPRHTPLCGATLSGTSGGTSGPKGPKTLVGGRVFLNSILTQSSHLRRLQPFPLAFSRSTGREEKTPTPKISLEAKHTECPCTQFLRKLASVLESRALKASCNCLLCPPKTALFWRKVHFSAGKCIFLQESAFFGRKLHFSVGKSIFCWKTYLSAVYSGGLRIMNGSLFLDG